MMMATTPPHADQREEEERTMTATPPKPDDGPAVSAVLTSLARAVRLARALLSDIPPTVDAAVAAAEGFLRAAEPGFEVKLLWKQVARGEQALHDLDGALTLAARARTDAERRRTAPTEPRDATAAALRDFEARRADARAAAREVDALEEPTADARRVAPAVADAVVRWSQAALLVTRRFEVAGATALLARVRADLNARRRRVLEHDAEHVALVRRVADRAGGALAPDIPALIWPDGASLPEPDPAARTRGR